MDVGIDNVLARQDPAGEHQLTRYVIQAWHGLTGVADRVGRRRDLATPAVDARVDAVELAGREVGVAAAHAEADHADLAAGVRLGTQVVNRALEVAKDELVLEAALGAQAGDQLVELAAFDA